MVLDARGIKGGWKTQNMPSPRVMGDFINMPDGKLLLINGAQQGIAGYGNVKEYVFQHPFNTLRNSQLTKFFGSQRDWCFER